MNRERRGTRTDWSVVLSVLLVAGFMAVGIQAHAEPQNQAVVSQHERATEAGIEVLNEGGNAADAALAVASTISVVEPWFSNVFGGGTWALYYDAETGEITSLDGVGPAGSNASAEDYAQRGGERGMHQAVVPGAWDGWMVWLDEFGEMELGQILEPAIQTAEEGYEVSPSMSFWLNVIRSDQIQQYPYTLDIYTGEDGELVGQGDTVHRPDLAETFRDFVSVYEDASEEASSNPRSTGLEAASDHFYRGPYAEAIVDFSDQDGGYLELDDFHGFEAELRDPIAIDYKYTTVYQNPPNSQGITMLIALNILEGFDFSDMRLDGPDAVHLQVEATKLAFADRHHHVGDPDFVDVPVQQLLSEEHAANRREQISMDSALKWPIDPLLPTDSADASSSAKTAEPQITQTVSKEFKSTGTTTFQIVDEEGNVAAVTTSLGAQFLAIPETGIHINDRMRMMSTEEGNPNQIKPGKKVRHTSNPFMATYGGEPYIIGGTIGSDVQPQGQIQQFIGVMEFGAEPEKLVSRRRFVSMNFPSGTFPYNVEGIVGFEEGFDPTVMGKLVNRGHRVGLGGIHSHTNMIVIDPQTGNVKAAADPRPFGKRGVGTAIVGEGGMD